MAENLTVCSIHPELKEKLKKFRFRKETNNAALVLKIDKDSKQIMLENEYEDCVLEDLVAELPSSQPRYIAISYCYKRDDGRVSYPLCFIFLSPQGCKPEQQMMYAGSKKQLVDVGGFTKDFEVRSADEITEEWLLDKLSFFR